MEKIIYLCIIVAIVVATAVTVGYKIIKIKKMPLEEKKDLLISYLSGLVVKAEDVIGSGRGSDKLKQVELMFEGKAPLAYKIILKMVGANSLKELIEESLQRVKKNFEK